MVNLRYVMFFLTKLLLTYSRAADIQEGRLVKSKNNSITIRVLENEPLNLIFEDLYASNLWCNLIGYDHGLVMPNSTMYEFFSYHNGTSILKVSNVTLYMSTTWACKLSIQSTIITYLFAIKMKSAEQVFEQVSKQVFVQANRRRLKFTASDWAQLEYDGVYKHKYGEGDFMDFKCSNGYNRSELGLRYYDTNGNEVFNRIPSADGNELRFQQKMRVSHDGSYIDCINIIIKSPEEHQREFIYRTIFIFSDIISRNNIKLRKEWEYTFTLDTKNVDGYVLNGSGDKSAEIQLLVELDRELVVLGLPESGVLYQYNENREKWVTHYEYTVNEALELTCMTRANRTPCWDLKSELNPLKVGNISETSGVTFVTATFLLNATHDLKSVTCVSRMNKIKPQNTTIVFHQKLKSHSNKIIDKALNGVDRNNPSPVIYVGYAIAALVAIVAAIWGFRWYTQKRITTNRERASQNIYEEPIPPFPSQWETNEYTYIINECDRNEKNDNEYTYIRNENEDGEILDNDIYLKSKEPCNAVPYNDTATYSGPSEHHYTEIDKKIIKTTKPEYSVPNKQDHVKNVPSTSTNTYSNCQEAKNTNDLNREDSNSYSNLLIFDSNKTYINFQSRDSIK